MSTQLNLDKIQLAQKLTGTYYRHMRFSHLLKALERIAFFRMYNGAQVSTSIDFDSTFNRADQREKNGTRTQESIAQQAYDKLTDAKAEFKSACKHCEFRFDCGPAAKKELIFWELVEDQKVRQRFRNRIKTRDFQNGLKSVCCARLLQSERLKKSEILESVPEPAD
ncbi:MAG: hypothetical protein ACK5MU_01325 [Candidatus Saccharimonadales bacterium]